MNGLYIPFNTFSNLHKLNSFEILLMFIFRQKLPLEYTAEIQGNVWTGSAVIPGICFIPTKDENVKTT